MDEVRLTRAQIEEQQLARLRHLLRTVLATNQFYKAKLVPAHRFEDLRTLACYLSLAPFTTKHELVQDQAMHPPYGTNLSFPLERYRRFHQTSGTTGQPLRWLDTAESWDSMVLTWSEVFHAAGVTAADRILFAFSFGPFIGFWLAFEAGERIGALCLPGGGLSSAARLCLMLENRVTVLCCTPTYALRLAEVAAEQNVDLASSTVKTIIVAGEPGGSIPATRQRLSDLWPASRIFDHHGMTETGPVTYECPAEPGLLHIVETAFLAEVIDPVTLAPAAPDAQGELVLTNLTRTASPLLRYRTGDLVKMRRFQTEPCACGRYEAVLEGGILGRIDDMIVIRGVNVYPSAIEAVVRRIHAVAEYRVRVSHANMLAELTIEIEPEKDCANPEALGRELQTHLQNTLALRVPVRIVAPGTLPRFEMKAHRWVRE